MNLSFAFMEVRVLKGKVVVVTGASRGIGAATAIEMASLGASVAVNYNRSEEAAMEVVRRIRETGGTAIAVKADVTVCQEVRTMVGQVEEKLGPIDVLVSNAAIGFPSVPFIEYEWRDFEAKLTGELKAAPCHDIPDSGSSHTRLRSQGSTHSRNRWQKNSGRRAFG